MTNLATDALSVPGLEHKHSWSVGGLVLGDNQGALPRFKLTDISGIHSLPDLVTDNKPRLSGGGEYPKPGRILGRTITYTGLLQCRTLGELRYQAGLWRGSALGGGVTLPEGVMTLVPQQLVGPGGQYHYKARVVQAEMDEHQAYGLGAMPTPWQREFLMALRLSDPRLYLEPSVQVTSFLGNGANDPYVDVSNPGSADSPPVIRIYGPVSDPRVHIGATQSLQLRGNLTAGQWVDIDFDARSITRDNGADWSGNRDIAASNWWDAGQPGIPGGVPGPTVSRVTLSGDAAFPGANSKVRVTFYPAMW